MTKGEEAGGAETLEALRAEIDRLDQEIHALILRRTEVVTRIADAKKAAAGGHEPGLAMRPAREADILRRRIAGHAGPLPVPVVSGLWRALITAKVALQGPFEVVVAGGDDLLARWDLARAHFGVGAPMRSMPTALKALAAARERIGTVAVLPAPEFGDWWPALGARADDTPRILGRLPFVQTDSAGHDGPAPAAVVARLPDDLLAPERSYVLAALPTGVLGGGLERHVEEAGFEGRVVAMGQAPGGGERLALLDLAGDMSGDPRLEEEQGALGRLHMIGGYAEPVAC